MNMAVMQEALTSKSNNSLNNPMTVEKARSILHKLLQDEHRDKKDKSIPASVKQARSAAIDHYNKFIEDNS